MIKTIEINFPKAIFFTEAQQRKLKAASQERYLAARNIGLKDSTYDQQQDPTHPDYLGFLGESAVERLFLTCNIHYSKKKEINVRPYDFPHDFYVNGLTIGVKTTSTKKRTFKQWMEDLTTFWYPQRTADYLGKTKSYPDILFGVVWSTNRANILGWIHQRILIHSWIDTWKGHPFHKIPIIYFTEKRTLSFKTAGF